VTDASDLVLAVHGLSVTFVGTRALLDAELTIRPGEFHALLGGNGSGKSTLIKVLAGVQKGDPGGTIAIGAEHVSPSDQIDPKWAAAAGLSFVHQDLGLFPQLSVAENLYVGVGFPSRNGLVNWKKLYQSATELLSQLGIDVDARATMSSLRPSDQTLVAIARASRGRDTYHGGILVLDEPTARLSSDESEDLLVSLKRYQAAGQTILYVTHRLDEVLRYADVVTVLRDGRRIATERIEHITKNDLIELISNQDVREMYPAKAPTEGDDVVLSVHHLQTGPVVDASFDVRRGEILGLAGLAGSGRTSILETVFGIHTAYSGQIELTGPGRGGGPKGAVRAGLGYVPEDRARQAAFLSESITHNVTATHLHRYRRFGLLHHGEEERGVRVIGRRLNIKADSVHVPLKRLSGGNQQKTILGRWLSNEVRLLLLDEPTQGVDVGARAEIYRLIAELRESGMAIVLVSSDDEELLGLSDRVAVLAGGRLSTSTAATGVDAGWLAREAHHAAGESS
jgi:ribose transport system ATP-binding protein